MDKDASKLRQQLVMTPQLQMAIRMLATPSRELPALVDTHLARMPGATAPLGPGASDPFDDEQHDDQPPYTFLDVSPFEPASAAYSPVAAPGGGAYVALAIPGIAPAVPPDPAPRSGGADVWVWGDPPQARANGRAFPRLAVVATDPDAKRQGSWLVRSLRARARTYEKVIAAAVALRPALASESEPARVERVSVPELAEAVGMHEATVSRVLATCRYQTQHGIWRLIGNPAGPVRDEEAM